MIMNVEEQFILFKPRIPSWFLSSAETTFLQVC